MSHQLWMHCDSYLALCIHANQLEKNQNNQIATKKSSMSESDSLACVGGDC